MDVSRVPFDPHVNPPSAKLLFPVQPAVPLLGSRGFVLSFTMQKCEVFAMARRNGGGCCVIQEVRGLLITLTNMSAGICFLFQLLDNPELQASVVFYLYRW